MRRQGGILGWLGEEVSRELGKDQGERERRRVGRRTGVKGQGIVFGKVFGVRFIEHFLEGIVVRVEGVVLDGLTSVVHSVEFVGVACSLQTLSQTALLASDSLLVFRANRSIKGSTPTIHRECVCDTISREK